MRIVYLHQYFASPAMPNGTRSYEMATRFAAAGHDVHVVASSRIESTQAPRSGAEALDGITVHWIPVKYDTRMGVARRVTSFLVFAVLAGWRARRLKADVVFATSTPLTIALPGVFAKRGNRAPMVFEVRDLWPEVPIAMGTLNHPALRWAAFRLERFAYRNADAVIALSPGMAAGIMKQRVPSGKVSVVPNACDNALFDVPVAVGQRFRDARPWLGDRPLVVYAGTLGRANGVAYLARLAHEVGALDADIRFLVVGDGPEENSVARLAAELGVLDRTFFIEGRMPKSAMPAVMSAATVSTSLFIGVKELEENSANKFFDTLAAGRPVAVNYGGWHADLVRDHEAGIVLDPVDLEAAAKSLVTFIRSEPRVGAARRGARRLADGEFDRDRLTAVALDVVEDVALRS
ncbi:MAG: glycosyltransferase family 4 protein [Aeromicrobium sp.]